MSNSKLYTDRLLSYWDQNLFGWKHSGYTHGASEVSQLCGDEVEFRLIVSEAVLEVVDVWARGCCVSECCAAMLAELARGKMVGWVNAYTAEEWAAIRQRPIGRKPQTVLRDARSRLPQEGCHNTFCPTTMSALWQQKPRRQLSS